MVIHWLLAKENNMANFTLDQTGQEIQDILDTVGNNQATLGQVLTADGSGGASWQNASGGDKIYLHRIHNGTSDQHIEIEMNTPTVLDKSSLASLLYDRGYIVHSLNSFLTCPSIDSPSKSLGSSGIIIFPLGMGATTNRELRILQLNNVFSIGANNNVVITQQVMSEDPIISITDTVIEL